MKSIHTGAVKWVAAIVCLAGLVSASFGQSGEVYSLNVVGFQKVTAPASRLQISATPFDQANPNIDSAVGAQLTGSDAYGVSDNILLWNVQGQAYSNYFIAGGVGEPYDGHWFTPALQPATNFPANLYPGRAFWIRSRQAFTQTVVFAGSLVSANCVTTRIPSGLSLLGYPYSAAIKLNDTAFSNGACGGDSFGSSDNILKWDAERQMFVNYFLAGDVGLPEYNWKWIIPQGLVVASNVYLQPGEGFWYRHRGSGFDWVETRPYSVP